MVMATETQKTNSEDAEIQTCTKHMNTQKRKHIQNRAQNKLYDGYGHRPTIQIQKLMNQKRRHVQNRKQKQTYGGYSHQPTKQSRRRRKPNMYTKNKNRFRIGDRQRFMMAMVTDLENKCRNTEIQTFMTPINTYN